MIRIALITGAILSVTTVATLGLRAVYQAGWDARESIAVQEDAARQRKTAEALLRASDVLAFEMGKAVASEQEALKRLQEIENGQPEDPAMCGISLDRMRALSEIR